MTTKFTTSTAPMTKEEFVNLFNTIQSYRDKFDVLADAAEALSEGFYVNFFPNLKYESLIVDLLNRLFKEDPENSIFDWFMYELNFGRDYKEGTNDGLFTIFESDNSTHLINSSEALYDYLVKGE